MGSVLKEIVIDVVIYYVAPYLGPVLSSLGVSAEVASNVITAIRVGAVLRGLSAIATALQHPTTQLWPLQTAYGGTTAPRLILYGTNKVAGVEVIPPLCSGSNGTILHEVLAVAGHKVSAIMDVYFNQDLIASSSIGAVTGGANDGLVNSGSPKYQNNAWIRRYTGSQTVVDFILNAAFVLWPSTSVGYGLSYIALSYNYNLAVYPNGKPAVTAIVQGKICYDPRLDTSPGANPTNPAYAAFTSNPALCIADFITDSVLGLGESPSNINWTLCVAAANKCDETPSVPGGTQTRYTCNAILDATARFEDNISALALSMMGTVVYSGGQWCMWAGSWQTPSFALADADVAGAVTYTTAIAYADRYNAVRGQYFDSVRNFQAVEYQAVRVLADEATDGEGPLWKQADFPACHFEYEAQRNGIILQRFSRRKKTWVIPFGMSAWPVRVNDTGTITLLEWGLNAQSVRCVGWQYSAKGTVQLTLQEAVSTDWNDPAVGTYVVPGAPSIANAGTYVPPAPTSLIAAGGVNCIAFTWSDPLYIPTDSFILMESATNNFAAAVPVWQGQLFSAVIPKSDQVTRYYWVYVTNQNGNSSGHYPVSSTAGVAAAANAVAAGQMGAGSVDPSTAVVLAKGSIPPMVPDTAFTYTSTTTTITINWTAITIYRPDGTSAVVTAGSQTVTGLVAGVTWNLYGYAVDNGTGTLTMSFVTGTSGTTGTPAICLTSAASLAQLAALAAGAYARGNIPLYKITAVTPVSGTGSGSGGGGGMCLHPDQLVDLAARAPVRAEKLQVGDLLRTTEEPAPIVRINRPMTGDWIQARFENGESATVTRAHLFVRADGELVAADSVRLGDILRGDSRNVEVRALKLVVDPAPCVALELDAPHLYLITRDGALSHNPKP